jgi:hypothetical protein
MPEIKLLDSLATYSPAQIAQLRSILRGPRYILTFNATQNWSLYNGLYQDLTLTTTTDFTIKYPSGVTIGETAFIYIRHNIAGTKILSFDSQFKTAGGASIDLSTGLYAVDRLMFFFDTGSTCTVTATKDIK